MPHTRTRWHRMPTLLRPLNCAVRLWPTQSSHSAPRLLCAPTCFCPSMCAHVQLGIAVLPRRYCTPNRVSSAACDHIEQNSLSCQSSISSIVHIAPILLHPAWLGSAMLCYCCARCVCTSLPMRGCCAVQNRATLRGCCTVYDSSLPMRCCCSTLEHSLPMRGCCAMREHSLPMRGCGATHEHSLPMCSCCAVQPRLDTTLLLRYA